MKSQTTGSSLSSYKHLDRSKSQSVRSTIKHPQTISLTQPPTILHNLTQDKDVFRIKNSLEEMFRRRSLNKTSIDQLERNRRHIKATNQTSFTFYGQRERENEEKLINLKYQNVKYKPLKYDYTHLYFPSRQRYVKTNKKGKTMSFKSQEEEYYGDIRLIDSCVQYGERRSNQCWYQWRRESESNSVEKEREKSKEREREKSVTTVSKFRSIGLKSRNHQNKSKVGKEIQINKDDVNLSPWENQDRQF